MVSPIVICGFIIRGHIIQQVGTIAESHGVNGCVVFALKIIRLFQDAISVAVCFTIREHNNDALTATAIVIVEDVFRHLHAIPSVCAAAGFHVIYRCRKVGIYTPIFIGRYQSGSVIIGS